MSQQKQFAGGLLALGISIAMQANAHAATEAPATSWLMSDAEVAAHKAIMAGLEGQAREDYRNDQYERLRQRARQHGFELPAEPPWAGATLVTSQPKSAEPAPVVPTGDDATDAEARHAELRERLQARREALQRESETSLQRLQKAASEQQKQVDAQMQVLSKGDAAPETAGEQPAAPVPMMPTVTPPPALAAEAIAEAPAVTAPPPMTAPPPAAPPRPPAAPATDTKAAAGTVPRFAPVEQTVEPVPDVPVPAPEAAPIVTLEPPPAAPPAPAAVDTTAGSTAPDADAMTAYRENLRLRFDEYMAEHRARVEEKARLQREQHEAAMEKNRAMRANRPGYPPYPYPAAPPSYGPRYPSAYPGYHMPYWQQ